MSVISTDNSPSQDYTDPDDQVSRGRSSRAIFDSDEKVKDTSSSISSVKSNFECNDRSVIQLPWWFTVKARSFSLASLMNSVFSYVRIVIRSGLNLFSVLALSLSASQDMQKEISTDCYS